MRHAQTPARGPEDPTDRVAAICAAHHGVDGPLLPILHAVQKELGCVPQEVLPVIALSLNRSTADIHGVVSFYHDFRDSLAGRHVIQLCRSEACQAVGAAALADALRDQLGIDWGGTTADGAVTLDPVYCLGLCACGPAAMVDGRPVARLDGPKVDALVSALTA